MTSNSTLSDLIAERKRDTDLCSELKQVLDRAGELMTAAKNAEIVVSFRFDKKVDEKGLDVFFVADFTAQKALRLEPTE